jgi:hypothetical protein
VWGYLRLVPHEGVTAVAPGASANAQYGDRRYADVELVDYSRPGFAVVYLEGEVPAGPPLLVSIEAGLGGVRFEPAHAVLPVGGRIAVQNRSQATRVVTCPAAELVRSLAPGESLEIPAAREGELELFIADAPKASARIFAAPGPFASVDEGGRFEILDVAPGPRSIHAWHPRFPPAAQRIELAPGHVLRVDLELGVGRPAPEVSHAP